MNMREDEQRGRCFSCAGTLGSHGPPAAGGGSFPEQLLCWVGLVLGVACLAVAGFVLTLAQNYESETRTAEATVKRDFHAKANLRGAHATYQVGHYDWYANFNFQGRTYKIETESDKPGEQYKVYFQADKPNEAKTTHRNPFDYIPGGAVMTGLCLLALCGAGLYLRGALGRGTENYDSTEFVPHSGVNEAGLNS